VTAYAQLSRLFAADGTPLHHHFSYLAIADLAAAAARSERQLEAQTLLDRALARVDPAPGPRLEQLAARARGLLAEPAGAGAYFASPLADPAGSTWPFERAQLQLDYGEWLRRQRRINDAKPVLADALETFRRIGAAPWTGRAESGLRACGVTAHTLPADAGALAGLTAQQREIIILAGRGLTNGEIADRLFLSPRTVASHLYRSYPKLGITDRHQLRDLIEQPAPLPVSQPHSRKVQSRCGYRFASRPAHTCEYARHGSQPGRCRWSACGHVQPAARPGQRARFAARSPGPAAKRGRDQLADRRRPGTR
jgi:DNA-binding CsgD family transcriptional regulator